MLPVCMQRLQMVLMDLLRDNFDISLQENRCANLSDLFGSKNSFIHGQPVCQASRLSTF